MLEDRDAEHGRLVCLASAEVGAIHDEILRSQSVVRSVRWATYVGIQASGLLENLLLLMATSHSSLIHLVMNMIALSGFGQCRCEVYASVLINVQVQQHSFGWRKHNPKVHHDCKNPQRNTISWLTTSQVKFCFVTIHRN